MIILLISGYAGSGKDTFADYFIEMCEKNNSSYKRYAFADKVKEEVSNMFKIPIDTFFTQAGKKSIVETKEGPKTCRELLIEHSALMKRVISNDYWAKLVCTEIDTTKDFILITDWRYNVEYESVHSYFGEHTIITVRIINPSVSILSDSSEHELDLRVFNYVINNNSSKDLFKFNISTLFEELFSHIE